MFAIILSAFATSRENIISRTASYYSFPLEAHSNTTFKIDVSSITFLLPDNNYVTSEVYFLGHNNSYKFLGSFSQKSTFRGVHFPIKGKIILRASKNVNIDCYFVRSYSKCRRHFLSTYPDDYFFAAKPNMKINDENLAFVNVVPNISIQNNQDICFTHISDSPVNSSLIYSTEESYDLISYKNRQYSGHGAHYFNSDSISTFYWHSDETTLSNFFFVNLSSSSKLTKYKFNFTIEGTSPLFLTYHSNTNLNPIYDHADTDLTSKKDTRVPTSLTVCFLVFLSSIFIVMLFLFASTRMAKKNDEQYNVLDHNEEEEDSVHTDEALVIEPEEKEK